MIRGNLGAAMQGLAVVPLFAGFDLDAATRPGRPDLHLRRHRRPLRGAVLRRIGSGSLFAKRSLKKLWRAGDVRDEAIRLAVEALYDAADDDSATGGPDLARQIYPVVMPATAEGTAGCPTTRSADVAEARRGRARPPRQPQRLSSETSPTEGEHAMSMPFYASRRADHARPLGVRAEGHRAGPQRRGAAYADGVLFVAENPSPTLHKVGEIYDRIGFAAVGRYNEFENLRVAGIRLADLRGYSYDRRDVTGRALANAYAQTLGTIFTEQQKPFEVELCVAEVGAAPATTSSTG